MIEQILQLIAEKMKLPHTNLGLLQGQMGNAIFFYNYARHIDQQYEADADKCLDEVIEGIQKVNATYADGLAGIGTGIEYLARYGFIDGNTNEILSDFDKTFQTNLIDTQTGIIGYGKYYLARLKNPGHNKDINPNTKLIKSQLSNIVDFLSADYRTFESICSVIDFLPDIINLNINKGKALTFFNYAVDLLETNVYEDIFWNKQPSTFNPLITWLLIFRSSKKMSNKNLASRALFFLEKYESDFRSYLAEEFAIKWAFLYDFLWKTYNCDVYKKLSTEWLGKIPNNSLTSKNQDLTISGMMLLSMNQTINDDWLDWFPLI